MRLGKNVTLYQSVERAEKSNNKNDVDLLLTATQVDTHYLKEPLAEQPSAANETFLMELTLAVKQSCQ